MVKKKQTLNIWTEEKLTSTVVAASSKEAGLSQAKGSESSACLKIVQTKAAIKCHLLIKTGGTRMLSLTWERHQAGS